jgi:hypothetical protein
MEKNMLFLGYVMERKEILVMQELLAHKVLKV